MAMEEKEKKLSCGERLEMHCKLKREKKLSYGEQFKLFLQMEREGKLSYDDDDLPLPMLPSVVEKLKANAKQK